MGIYAKFPVEARLAEWHETPAALDLIASIDINDLYLNRPCLVMGADELVITGDAVEALHALRAEHAARQMGSFSDAADKHAYIAAMGPDAREVLAGIFGDPRNFNARSEYEATTLWRWAFEARAAA